MFRKGDFIWNEERSEFFHKPKFSLSNCSILSNPDFSKPFSITTDASNQAIGGVLSQENAPIALISRTFNLAERNYSVIEKEMLAIYWCIKKLRHQLHGQSFTVYTDHKPLMYGFKTLTYSARITKWTLYLSEFDYETIYKPGNLNIVADALFTWLIICALLKS